jgi:hypothetical protein
VESQMLKDLGRRFLFSIRRPKPPVYDDLKGTVVIVGSAPAAAMPVGLDDTFTIITVNASQYNARKWGVTVPDVTFMQYNQIEGTTENAINVRRILNGERTKSLYVLRWPHDLDRLEKGLRNINYRYEQLNTLTRYDRMALHKHVLGYLNLERSQDEKFSNGITAVLFAICNGAQNIILSGINPNSSGHSYSSGNLKRYHASADKDILIALKKTGHRIFTADSQVAEQMGLPLWTG